MRHVLPQPACSSGLSGGRSRALGTRRPWHGFGAAVPHTTKHPTAPQSRRRMECSAAPGSAAAAGGGPGQRRTEARTVRLAVVGDVHGQWDADSEAALQSLGADVAVFLGDFGEEDCQLVGQVAAPRQPAGQAAALQGGRPRRAVILGNHDAWYSLTERGRVRLARKLAQSNSALLASLRPGGTAGSGGSSNGQQGAPFPQESGGEESAGEEAQRGQRGQRARQGPVPAPAGSPGPSPGVSRQLALLGDSHIGFGSAHYPDLNLSVVGGRPFSKGGKQWSDVAAFYRALYDVGSPQQSAARIADTVAALPAGACCVLAAHNGPTGLGSARHDPCGVDWMAEEGDHGDPDLQAALADLAARGQAVPLVLFGHMHDSLKGGGRRNMAAVDPATGTVYVNCAVVPRIKEVLLPPGFAAPAGSADGAAAGNGVTSGGSGAAAGGGAAGVRTVRSPKREWQEAEAVRDGAAGHHSKQQRGASGGSSSGAAPQAAAAAQAVRGHSPEQQQQQQQAERRIRAHHFVVVELRGGALTSAKNVWVGVTAHDRSSNGSSSSSSGAAQQGGASAAGAAGNRDRLCVPLWEEGLVQLQEWSEEGGAPGGDGLAERRPGSSNGGSDSAGASRAYAVYQAHEGAWRTVVVSGVEARPAERGQQQRVEK